LSVKFCHLSLVTLGKLEKPLALKSLEIVDSSVYHFLRPSQYLDADIVPSDLEVKRLLSLNRSNLGEDLAYCSQRGEKGMIAPHDLTHESGQLTATPDDDGSFSNLLPIPSPLSFKSFYTDPSQHASLGLDTEAVLYKYWDVHNPREYPIFHIHP
jgi:hypothetical protein